MPVVDVIPLHETTRQRYLTYALSVITSRALPDVRDGLKPVQRRILYAMATNLRLGPDSRFRKSATIVGECFVAGTRVSTPAGLVPIELLEPGDEVHTQTGTRAVTHAYVMPPQPLCRVTLRDGRALVCTPGQQVKVLTPSLEIAWRDAADLAPGDFVVCRSTDEERPDDRIGLGEAYLAGLFLADGWVDRHGSPRVCIGGKAHEPLERAAAAIEALTGCSPPIAERDGFHTLRLSRSAASETLLRRFGWHDKRAESIQVPEALFSASLAAAGAFVSGFADGDGSVHRTRAVLVLTSVCEPFLRDVQTVLHRHGIFARLVPYRTDVAAPHHLLEWALEIDGHSLRVLASHLALSHPEKRARLAAALGRDLKQEAARRLPHLGPAVLQEVSDRHLGGGWYRAPDGTKVRSSLRYADGTKLRYGADLQEDFRLHGPQLDGLGVRQKMQAIGSRYLGLVEGWEASGVSFAEVRSVEEAPAEVTYDVQVEGEHEFVANGVVVHNCMGKYHPHGDSAIYEAMVRMAQPFSLRAPLVDGQGNFGSLDGDSAAAMRYTEARLTALGAGFLDEIRKQTVAFRPTYDGTLFEPVVLPAQAPNLLVNGATGIAVGMATNIPPHALGEVVDACLKLLRKPSATAEDLMEHLPGPDFPTGGRILNTRAELLRIYETGEGAVELRGEYEVEGRDGRGTTKSVVITSVPYGLPKADLIEKIADHVRRGKLPMIVDVRDESTDDVRIVLELQRGADEAAAMAYLLKHTPLQARFHVNLTALVPTANPEVCQPEKLDLVRVLRHFLDFRLEVVTKRLAYDLAQLERRIHILKGFEKIFGGLDEAIKIIRASKNKPDAAQRLMHRFGLDDEQADAVLEIKLYRLAQLEIDLIIKELKEKEAAAEKLRALLADESARWTLVRKELRELKKQYADERRTTIAGPDTEIAYSAEDYIVDEDVVVLVTRDGWVKRQRSYTDLQSVRVREGDEVGFALGGSTRAPIAFFTNHGRAYTMRVADLPPTAGYGDPVQKYFDFSDGERIVGVVVMDERVLPEPLPLPESDPLLFAGDGMAVTGDGMAVRLELAPFSELSNKNGRVYVRTGKGQVVVAATLCRGDEHVCLASAAGRALIFPAEQVPVFKGAAKGVIAMRLDGKKDRVLGAALSTAARDGLEVETTRGRTEIVRTTKFEVTNRGGKGRTVIQRGGLQSVKPAPVEQPLPPA